MEKKQTEKQNYTTPYEFEGRIPLKQAVPLGLQHVLAMFVGNLTPLLIITNLCAALGGAEDLMAVQVSPRAHRRGCTSSRSAAEKTAIRRL